MKKIGIINYGCGNLASLHNSLTKIECKFDYILNVDQFNLYDAYILPGVGNFKHGMSSLINSGMDLAILESVKKGKDLLGICLGMQILFEDSTEGDVVQGLSLISGSVERIGVNEKKCRVPHMGWNNINIDEVKNVRLFNGINKEASYYFVHSYHVRCKQDVSQANTNYCEENILAAFEYENISGVQFHPEKSQDAGLMLLNNFCNN